VKEQLESIVLQMYRAGVRCSEAVREFQKTFILTVLKDQRGNQCKAAEKLGVHRNTLRRTIRELEMTSAPHVRWEAATSAIRGTSLAATTCNVVPRGCPARLLLSLLTWRSIRRR
jgi:Bacterial regulatory protein, Fis family